MSDIVIKVENLTKEYRLGIINHGTLHHDLQSWWAKIRGKEDPNSLISTEPHIGSSINDSNLLALNDVSFRVKSGDVLGIIGRNGAGKSTLLKILTRVTAPTAGTIKIRGRVASLLEVGTGFHPELTGRENIFLNGAILGMTKDEINRKFSEIVDFSEIEQFIDTPVKRYSSGMYVRLAFAVAAHLEPEILIIDEVLAVGDVMFQKKCLGKMGDIAREGRTVLFVSHNMAAVENLCTSGIVLQRGTITFAGNHNDAIAHYLSNLSNKTLCLKERTDRLGSGEIRIVGIDIKDAKGNPLDLVASGQEIFIFLHFECEPGFFHPRLVTSVFVKTLIDSPVFLNHNRLTGDTFESLPERGAFVCHISKLPLPAATYKISSSIMVDDSYIDNVRDAVDMTVTEGKFYDSGEVPPVSHGVCLVNGRWSITS